MALPEDEAKQVPDAEDGAAMAEETPEGQADVAVAQAADSETADRVDEALQAALVEVEKFKDLALRAEAEVQNIQRRTARDIENAHKFGLERFVQNLLPVVDSLEKAIEVTEQATGDQDAVAEGMRLCHKLMVDTLAKEGVEMIDPLGVPFDPNEHQAMSLVENPDMEPNSVFAVVQKGFKMNGRLVRAAMVMVTKAQSEPGATTGE